MQCPVCKAPHREKIPNVGDFVRCAYCGSNIAITRQTEGKARYREINVGKFFDYIKKKGLKCSFDEVTNQLTYYDGRSVFVTKEGQIDGNESFRIIVERWLNQFLDSR